MRTGTAFALLALPLASAYHLAAGCASRGASVARAASQMQMVPGENKVIDSQDTYNVMMRVLLETNTSVADQISASYHMVDYAFLQKLEQRAQSETDEKVSVHARWSESCCSQQPARRPTLQKPSRPLGVGLPSRPKKRALAAWVPLKRTRRRSGALPCVANSHASLWLCRLGWPRSSRWSTKR